MRENLQKNEVDEYIIQIVKEKKPENVEELVKLTQNKFPLPKQEILNRILDLQKKGKLRFKPREPQTPETLRYYLRSTQISWYWITMILALSTALLTFIIPENAFPLVYARYVLGSIFVLWLPGYAFIKALFPEKELDSIERVALSIGMSLALVPITGLLLNYTPWGIRITPITLSLLTLTVTFATAAIIREHQTKTIPKV